MNISDEAVVRAILQSFSPDTTQRQPAELQLLQWENVPQFATILYKITCATQLDLAVRLFAAVNMRNVISKVWGKRNQIAMSEPEKAQLRTALLQNMSEPNPQIGLQLALVIATISRSDFPQAWQDLLPRLLEIVQRGNSLQRTRALLTLHHVFKTLLSKRLQRGKLEFQQISGQLSTYLMQLFLANWQQYSANLKRVNISSLTPEEIQSQLMDAENCILLIKVMNRIICHGLPEFGEQSDTSQFLLFLHQILATDLLPLKSTSAPTAQHLTPSLDKVIIQIGKLLINVLEQKAGSFVFSVSKYVELFGAVLTQSNVQFWNITKFPQRFQVQCVLFMKQLFDTDLYFEKQQSQSQQNGQTQQQQQQQTQPQALPWIYRLVSTDLLNQICGAMVLNYFKMNQEELSEWQHNPEDFYIEQETDMSDYKLKNSAASLFLTILEKFGETRFTIQSTPDGKRITVPVELLQPAVFQNSASFTLAEKLAEFLQQTLNSCPATQEGIIIREVIYMALGLAFGNLSEFIDFRSWFTNSLYPELTAAPVADKGMELGRVFVKRRLLWLIQCWVKKIPNDFRPALYAVIDNSLKQETDVVVLLSTVDCLRSLVDDVSFYVDPFIPYLHPIIHSIFRLLGRLTHPESRVRVLNCVKSLVGQVEEKMEPFVFQIMNECRKLWGLAFEHNDLSQFVLLLQSIVEILSHLIEFCSSSTAVEELVAPIILVTTNLSSPQLLFLIDDGLRLWWQLSRQSTKMSNTLLSLFPNILKIMEMSFEHTQIVMRVIEEYMIVGSEQFTRLKSTDLMSIFCSTLGNVKDEPTLWTLKPVDVFFQLLPQEGWSTVAPVVEKLWEVLSVAIRENAELVIVSALSVFCRLLLQNPTYVVSFLTQSGQLTPFFDLLFDKFDSMSNSKQRKLFVLSVCTLLTFQSSETLKYFSSIVSTLLSVINVQLTNKPNFEFDEMLEEEKLIKNGEGPKRELLARDPVFHLEIVKYFKQNLERCAQLNGANVVSDLYRSLDPTIAMQLTQALQ